MKVHQDDLTKLERNITPIERPFTADELSTLIEVIRNVDPTTAEVTWWYAEFCDPYRISDVPHVQIGREYFVRASGDRWVWFNDLPEDVADNLWSRHHHTLAFPAGLALLIDQMNDAKPQAAEGDEAAH